MRKFEVNRKTKETDTKITIDLDGQGDAEIRFSSKFMQHMLTVMIVHSGFNLNLEVKGDLQHHIIEDVALCIGKAIRGCIDNLSSIARFGHAIVPMDCSLAIAAVDMSNRPYSVIDLSTNETRIEDTSTEDIVHFLKSLASTLAASIHVKVLYGDNEHHKIEAAFKALGIALRSATRKRETGSPPASSKGVL
jgi:imidazoleglycerol-phosphate dehydratase